MSPQLNSIEKIRICMKHNHDVRALHMCYTNAQTLLSQYKRVMNIHGAKELAQVIDKLRVQIIQEQSNTVKSRYC